MILMHDDNLTLNYLNILYGYIHVALKFVLQERPGMCSVLSPTLCLWYICRHYDIFTAFYLLTTEITDVTEYLFIYQSYQI